MEPVAGVASRSRPPPKPQSRTNLSKVEPDLFSCRWLDVSSAATAKPVKLECGEMPC